MFLDPLVEDMGIEIAGKLQSTHSTAIEKDVSKKNGKFYCNQNNTYNFYGTMADIHYWK